MKQSKLDLKKKNIREFFSTFKPKREEDRKESKDKILTEGLTYVQMSLPVEEITKDFEDSLKEKIDRNIINAKMRIGTESDLESLMNVYNKSWLTSNTPFRPITTKSLKIILDDPDTTLLIAKVYGQDSGFVLLDFEGENKEYGVIAGLGIVPKFQRRGLGTILGMAAWSFFKEKKNIKELRCEVYEDNKVSYAFINGLGFKEFGKKTYKKEDFLTEKEIE